jgi:hypothetical protein
MDRSLREAHQTNSLRFPPFRHQSLGRNGPMQLNVFLVILNAEIKFRRYLEMIRQDPPTPLPNDVLTLIHRTVELVELVYWRPVPTKGSHGEAIMVKRLARMRHPDNGTGTDHAKSIERRSNEEREVQEDETILTLPRRRRKLVLPADMDLQSRMAYGRALMSGHGTFPCLSPL